MDNPFPETIADESTGCEVENQRHIDWEAGARAESERITNIIKAEFIPGRDMQALLRAIRKK